MSDQFELDNFNQFILFDALLPDDQSSWQAPNLNLFVKVTITLKKMEDGSTTDITFTNREILSNLDYWPLLKRVDSLGAKMGPYLPENSRSTFTIDNSQNSFGSERRFSDLLDRYSVIEQKAIISIAQLPLGKEVVVDGDFTEVWRSFMTEVAFSGDQLRISMSRAIIPVRLATKVVNKTSFPDAPSDSLGKQIPLIFSDTDEWIEIQPIPVTDTYHDGSEDKIDYAYATTFADKYLPSGTGADAVKIFVENQQKEFQEVTFLSDPTVGLISFIPSGGTPATSTAWGSVKEYGYKIVAGENATGGEILTGSDWYLASNTASTSVPAGDYTYTFKIYDSKNGWPSTVLASDTIDNTSTRITHHGTYGGVYVFRLEFYFNKPVVVPLVDGDPANSSIFITLSRSDSGNAFSLAKDATVISTFEKYKLTDTTAGVDQNFVRTLHTADRDFFVVYGLAVSHDVSGGSSAKYQNGLGHAQFTIRIFEQDGIPDLSKLRLIAKSKGIRDSSTGTISGMASSRLNIPLYQIRLLMMDWDGSAWAETYFNASKFSSTHADAFGSGSRWNIKTAGASQGRARVRDVIEDICRNGACRVVPYVSGNSNVVGLYAEGTNIATSFIIDDENAKLISFEIGGVDTVINKVQMVFNRTIQSNLESLLAEGGLANYREIVDSNTDSLDVPYGDIAKSLTNWGERPLDSISFGWLTQAAPARSVAALILRKYNLPIRTITLEVPYNKYATIENMQTGIVKMTALPDYYGTSLDAKQPTAGTSTDATDMLKGHYWKRYKSYRVQVEGNDIIFSATEPLKRVLTLNVLEDINIT